MQVKIGNVLYVQDMPEILRLIVSEDLTYDNPIYKEAVIAGRRTVGILPVLKNFTVDMSGGFLLPRGYLDKFKASARDLGIKLDLVDNRTLAPFETAINHTISLRNYQHPALVAMSMHSEGLLVAPAGSGKTIMGIALIIMGRQKCLWITHTKQLLYQFVDRIKKFTDITDDDIGLIYKGKWDTGKPVTAALVQTLIRDEEKLKDISNNFGTVIGDEIHHCPSTTFTKVISTLNPYYLYGLTATPERRDGLEEVMVQNIGAIRHIIDREAVKDGIITPKIITRYLKKPTFDEGTYHQLLTALVESEKRNNIIVADVITEATKGNVCIVTTERVAHAETLENLLKRKWKKTGSIIGKHTDSEREEVLKLLHSGDITVLVCTSHLLGEGFDFPPLNRLYLGLPFRNPARCEQLVGRVQRICEGKEDAKIYDYVDDHGLTKHQYKNFGEKGCRYSVYKNLGCIIL